MTAALLLAISNAHRRAEADCVHDLLRSWRHDQHRAEAANALSREIVTNLRRHQQQQGDSLVQALMQEFALSSQEGKALMSLAEALLRIPDKPTRDALIHDQLLQGNWIEHVGHATSLTMQAATWGLIIGSKLVQLGGESLIRQAVEHAIKLLGKQFVAGQTIDDALQHASHWEQQGFSYSFDMLGEAAMTAPDADRYTAAYTEAIHAIGRKHQGQGVYRSAGISIKLSALHPRYQPSQQVRVMSELWPRLLSLAELAREYEIGLHIDAEESERLELSLCLLKALCEAPGLQGWQGIGFVVQAYQKRAPYVIDRLIDLATRTEHRLMIRLVKGAYWDAEIKRTQQEGQVDYPVFTRKAHTDVSYLVCAQKLLAAPKQIYAEFATHNALTLAMVYQMAEQAFPDYQSDGQYEFQCLHGMGEALYSQVVGNAHLKRHCRIYAPVGSHETLLAYLVRRLLENGANTSFVNQLSDSTLSLDGLLQDPIELTYASQGHPHPAIPLPSQLYGQARVNAAGFDFSNARQCEGLSLHLKNELMRLQSEAVLVEEVSQSTIDDALRKGQHAASDWRQQTASQRAQLLLCAAERLQSRWQQFVALLVFEAHKTLPNAVGEVREAIDFLRYYAAQIRQWDGATHIPRGLVLCISPWNFPLSILLGQVSAALAAGNTVLAKPAEQTPRIAQQIIALLHEVGFPSDVVQLLCGAGETVGACLVADARVQGVLFTGSTQVASLIQQSLAQRLDCRGQPVMLIAETGGQNAMLVDASALAEQVVADAMMSAFDSAGQRCSSARILALQEEVAKPIIDLLEGAMAQLQVGDPALLATDIGPLIDSSACDSIQVHIEHMKEAGCRVVQAGYLDESASNSASHLLPTLIEVDDLSLLKQEVFGPVLHVLRFARSTLPKLLRDINRLDYGLTMGLQSRLESTCQLVEATAQVGNLYINRSMTGAVVGVQPFGGEGLSGTGPKAGGPLYLYRLLTQHPMLPLSDGELLAGPTGESNRYHLHPRSKILCLGPDLADLNQQLLAVLATCNQAFIPEGLKTLLRSAPAPAGLPVQFVAGDGWLDLSTIILKENPAAIMSAHQGADLLKLQKVLADIAILRSGDLLALVTPMKHATTHPDIANSIKPPSHYPLYQLMHERVVTINTAAAGGNASLMTLIDPDVG
ncbi:bifunctional proline dehydrogenase/L-glutamate gamma-semialdehyde dehydrogenase PutA [Ampullimonas aquatilis]|uniref:bifunctional proline dehydrogenase/L-glutamate gamma-semialdehyde dehydrogenase PutA n=1 Tax=Ampullimonas aquatilis TaxID=1341549 RepID=UPI003C7216A4